MHSRGGSDYSPLRLRVPPSLPGAFSSTLVDSEHPMSFTLIRAQLSATNSSQSYHGYRRSNIPSKEENGLVERANQEAVWHLRAMLFDARLHDKWSYEQLPMVQRIMNTVEKTSTGVSPAELILNNSIQLSNRILAPGSANPTSRVALSGTMDNWVTRQHTSTSPSASV
jgi:hypothetical protein